MDRRGRGIVSLASNAVAGRAAHINWYYYGPERQYFIALQHIALVYYVDLCVVAPLEYEWTAVIEVSYPWPRTP